MQTRNSAEGQISPSLLRFRPASRRGEVSPTLQRPTSLRPDSPFIPELAPSPCNSSRASPSLEMFPNFEAAVSEPIAVTNMKLSFCKRASRMARPAEPSKDAKEAAAESVVAIETRLRNAGMVRVVDGDMQRFRHPSASTGKGPAVRAASDDQDGEQQTTNHMVTLKSKDLNSYNEEPNWVLGTGASAPLTYTKLAQASMKTNAVSSSVTKREPTQGAANQTSRINCKSISQAAAAQATAVAVSMAMARQLARNDNIIVANPMATNAVNPCGMWKMNLSPLHGEFFAVTITSQLIFNASPTKLGSGCVLTVARELAQGEIDNCMISERMGDSNYMLDGICRAIVQPGKFVLDPVWASWVLIVYLCCHPEGRALLRSTPLTDVDFQTATAFEQYGRSEVTRRARLEVQQQGNQKRLGKECFDLEEHALETATATQKTLGTKRKRGAKGAAAGSTSDSSGLLLWWFEALQCENAVVLMSMIAHGERAVKEAAAATLRKQAGSATRVAENIVIKGISETNALTNAKALAESFVGRKQTETPAAILWNWQGKRYVGFSRTKQEARSTVLHACKIAPATVQPGPRAFAAVVWSVASMQLSPKEAPAMVLPGLLERLRHSQTFAQCGNKRGEATAERIASCAQQQADPARKTEVSGLTRSTISLRTRIRIHNTQKACAKALFQEMKDMCVSTATPIHNRIPVVEAVSQEQRQEPLCTPASRLAVGIVTNEELRVWTIGKTRKNDPCKVLIGTCTQQERTKDVPLIVNAEPPPLLTIVDFGMETLNENSEEVEKHKDGTTSVEASIALHVCGDAVVRVPEMLRALRLELHDSCKYVLQSRAILWAASLQASYVSNVGPTICSGFVNTAISSSKKIAVADNTRLLLLSAFDVYAAGLTNVEPSFVGTPYAGTYGCCLDTGVTPPGCVLKLKPHTEPSWLAA